MSNCIAIKSKDKSTHPPIDIEVLAWHETGKNWHQVCWNGLHWKMRWNSEFYQFFLDYTHWMPMPPGPEVEKKASKAAMEEME
jgi:hypothetical protein